MDSVALHYPNYEWPWILRVDASGYACGTAHLQQRPSDGALLISQAIYPRISFLVLLNAGPL